VRLGRFNSSIVAITGVVNPTTIGTFYARIFTFSAFSGAGSAAQWLTTTDGSNITIFGITVV